MQHSAPSAFTGVRSKMSSVVVLSLFDPVCKIDSHGHGDYTGVCFAGLDLIAVFDSLCEHSKSSFV